MERMETLRETVARALAGQESAYDDRHWEAYTAQADAVLAALGLDDYDAAVGRAKAVLEANRVQGESGHDEHFRAFLARRCLKAALTATAEAYPSTDNPEGDNDGEH